MKKITILFLLFCSLSAFSQNSNTPWMKSLDKSGNEKPTFKEVQDAFESHWLTHDKSAKGSGYKPFKRFENIWSSRVNENGHLPTAQDLWSAWQYKKAFGQANMMMDQSNWQSIGPFDYTQANAQPAGMGRLNCITIDPSNSNTWYVGAPGGGLWRTTDSGNSWTVLTDEMPRVSVSAIAVDYNDPNTIYITTGDDDGVYVYAASTGVHKSTDGGLTWTATGLNASNLNGSAALSEIFIDPTNSNKLICSGTDGVYTTTDAGVTWTQTLNGNNIRDMRLKPGDAQTVYAVSPTAFYKSTDGGSNFTQITSGMPTNTHRMVIDVTPANANYVYLFSVDATNTWQHGIYRSTDSGDNFSLRNTDTFTLIGNQQVWYNMAIGVSDIDANEVYVGTMDVWRSSNGGTSWSKLNRWDQLTDAYTHADIHSLRAHNGRMFCTSDGGIYSTVDNGTTFQDHSAGLQIGEFFNVAVAVGNVNNVSGGLQDNGGFGLGVNGDWRGYHPGDGINTLITPADDNTYYGFIQGGQRLYISNRADGYITWVGKPANAGTGVWETPLASDSNGEIYAAWDRLFKLNKNTNTWETVGTVVTGYTDELEIAPSDPMRIVSSGHQNLRVSTDGGVTYDFDTNVVGNAISDIAIHQTNPDIMWITTDGDYANKGVFKTTDGGYTWTDITNNFPAGEFPTTVVHQGDHPLNPIFVATDLGVYRLDDSSPDWEPFFINLPNTDIRDLEINLDDQSITAATYGRGLWRSTIPVQLHANDVRLIAISNPISNSMTCGATTAQILLKNNGLNTINSIDISYTIDGGTSSSFNWNGTLLSTEQITVNLPEMELNTGSHSLGVIINISNDANIANNNKTVNFLVNETGELNVVNSFETASDELLIVNNVWERGVPSGTSLNATATGTSAYGTNLSGNYPADTEAYLMSNCYDFTLISNPILKFQMAFELETDWDWGNVEYSIDGGSNWAILGTVNSQPNWYNSSDSDATGTCFNCPGAQWTGNATTMTEYAYNFTANATLGETDLTTADNITFRIALHSDNIENREGMVIDDFVIEGTQIVSRVSPKAYLQGALLNPNVGEEHLMRDDLRIAGLIPTISPYSDGLTCDLSVFNTGGTSGTGANNDDIVDWVFVELRDAIDNTVLRISQSALLQRDGDIVNFDGISSLEFNIANTDYYLVVKHRNHLGVMTVNAVTLSGATTTIDFTNASSSITFGTDAQTTFGMPNGVVAMWAGDTNGDGRLNYSGALSDVPGIRSQVFNDPDNSVFGGPPVASYQSEGYNGTDVDMNGLTVYSGGSSDVLHVRNNIFNNPSNSIFGGPPTSTYLFTQQLPEGANN
ncbi:glycosyl hydrolase [uncultured Lacinutrix sp.]|uniref:glycosyl hydrolase n=1 Tax=uncultured Lacinutrix sp. TaxID=574032 RepID=UPI00262CEF45|nr:glycosyl hydrolase [uncultured Lacinutrix sp.]